MKKITLISFLLGTLGTLISCADGNWRPYRVDRSFGQVNTQLIQAQIADQHAAKYPPTGRQGDLDGYAGFQTMKSYRQGFAQSIQPSSGISINLNSVGGNSGSTPPQ
jgi:hypothetical protein